MGVCILCVVEDNYENVNITQYLVYTKPLLIKGYNVFVLFSKTYSTPKSELALNSQQYLYTLYNIRLN